MERYISMHKVKISFEVIMIIKQVRILDATEHTNTFYTFQSFVNESLLNLSSDKDVSDVKIEYASPSCIVISYSLEVDKNEVEI